MQANRTQIKRDLLNLAWVTGHRFFCQSDGSSLRGIERMSTHMLLYEQHVVDL